MAVRKTLLFVCCALAGLRAGACECSMEFEDLQAGRVRVVSGDEHRLTRGAMYSLYFAIEITDCMSIDFDVSIAGEEWNNEAFVPGLQPMSKIQWREDGMRLVANGIFRAAATGTYEIVVLYKDETMEESRETRLGFVVAERK